MSDRGAVRTILSAISLPGGFTTIRGRLAALALIAVIPIIGLFAWNAWHVRQFASEHAELELLRLTRLIADDVVAKVLSAQRLLHALGAHPAVRAARGPACGELLAAHKALDRSRMDFIVLDSAGRALCHSGSGVLEGRFAERDYFARASASPRAVIGRPVTSRLSGRLVLPVALALRGASGEVERVIATGIDLAPLGESPALKNAAKGTALTLWDEAATILYRHPGNEQWAGKRYPEMARHFWAAGTVEGAGVDGVARVYAFERVGQFQGAQMFLSLGLARDELTAAADRIFLRGVVGLAVVVMAVLALGWALAERYVRRPIVALDEAHRRLAAGEPAVRVPEEGVAGELGRLLRGFNATAAALEARQAELHASAAQLERRVAERTAQLETLHREMADLYDNAPCGYHSVDENGLIVRINETWLRWLGYSREEVVGRMRHPDLMTPASAERFRKEVFPLFRKQGWLKEVEFEYRRKDGSAFPGSLQASSVYDENGRYLMSRTTVFDISERKRAEADIALKNAQLQRANELKSQFLATMSHELRTPLNAIIGFAEVLKDGLAGEINEEQKRFAGDIYSSGRHLLSLINDILDLSKVEAGMMTLEREPVDVGALLHGSLTMLKERAMKQRVSLQVELEPGLPALSADSRKLKQIAYNLVSNAVKFTPAGGKVRVAARRVLRAQAALPGGRPGRMGKLPQDKDQFIEIAVADTGIGIAEADLERLFQPFVQIDSALSRRHEGTGLGLAMVLRLAELHGGTAGVSSVPGSGSTFLVWLPLTEAQPPAQQRGAPRLPAKRAEAAEPLALVIEDDDDAAAMIERALRAEGFRCRRAATAEEGLVRAAKERPQLITLDVFLPHMDGWELLERLRQQDELADIPVVIVSVAPNLEHGVALGATRVLQKPFSKEELSSALAGIIPARAGSSTVLIVDDNPQAVELLASYLEGSECRVLRAYGGREAIEAARRARPDVILLDLVMPDLSGFEVVERLKAEAATAAIPVIVVTSKDLSAEERSALSGSVERIEAKSGLEAKDFTGEVRRAMQRPKASA